MVMDPTLLGLGVGGALGYIIKPGKNGEQIMTPIKMDKEALQAAKPLIYKVITLDMATARSLALGNWEFPYPADQIIIINRGASVACQIRINEDIYEPLDLRDFKELRGLIWRFFITNAAGVGSIDLVLMKGGHIIGVPLSGEEVGGGAGGGVPPVYTLRTTSTVEFIAAILTNATDEANIAGLVANKVRITGVSILSDQQLDYRLIFFGGDTFANADPDVDAFRNEVELNLPGFGFQIGGAGLWYMSVNGLEMDYQDNDGTSELHAALQNLSAAAKIAGVGGEVVVIFTYEERD